MTTIGKESLSMRSCIRINCGGFRAVVTLVAAVALCPVTSAEPATATEKAVEIEIGNLASSEDSISWLNAEIDAFEKVHPYIKVTRKDFVNPWREAHPLNSGPELARNIIGIDSHMGDEVPYLVERGDIVPIEQFLPDPDFDAGAFDENLWDGIRYQSKRWGVPWEVWGDVLVLDWELFEDAGITSPPATWEELLTDARLLTKTKSDPAGPEQWGLRLSSRDDTLQTLLLTLVFQQDGEVMKDGTFDLDTPQMRKALELMHELGFSAGVAKIDRRSLAEVLTDRSVRYAIHFEYNNRVAPVMNNSKFRLAPMPTLGGRNVTFSARRLYFAIRRSTLDEERASWELVKWFSRPDVSLPAPLSTFPCRNDIATRPEFREREAKGVQGLGALLETIRTSRDLGDFANNRLAGLNSFSKDFAAVLTGDRKFDDVVAEAESRANSLIVVPENGKK